MDKRLYHTQYIYPRLLHKRYRILSVVKEDIDGAVFIGTYTNRFLRRKRCIIKAGRNCTPGIINGNPIHGRLHWQAHVHKTYAAQEYVPKCVDYFYEGNNAYLVLEYIKGMPLAAYLQRLNPHSESWHALRPAVKHKLICLLLNIIEIMGRFHRRGYVYRGISSHHIFVDRQRHIYFIDAGMAWSRVLQKPLGAFGNGCAGFMAPEQKELQPPTEKADIYGLGVLMVNLFTGLGISGFTGIPAHQLREDLYFLTGSMPLATLIGQCLHGSPAARPGLEEASCIIKQYQREMEISWYTVYDFQCTSEHRAQLQAALCKAAGNMAGQLLRHPDIWQHINNHDSCTVPGDDAAGALYLLAGLVKHKVSPEQCVPAYYSTLAFVKEQNLVKLQHMNPGLWHGAAGVAVALAAGMQAELIPDKAVYRGYLLHCLELPCTGTDVREGAAGQGIAVNFCRNYLDETAYVNLLQRKTAFIMMLQQKNGCWQEDLCFATGTAGITWFLLDYAGRFNDEWAAAGAIKALRWLKKHMQHLQDLFRKKGTAAIVQCAGKQVEEMNSGILTFIKAYEVLKIPAYKAMAESALYMYPRLFTDNDFTQGRGLAGLGELYLEAFRVLGAAEWQLRANWIANLLLHCCLNGGEDHHHATAQDALPAAALGKGKGGMLHFVLRYLYPEQTGHFFLQ